MKTILESIIDAFNRLLRGTRTPEEVDQKLTELVAQQPQDQRGSRRYEQHEGRACRGSPLGGAREGRQGRQGNQTVKETTMKTILSRIIAAIDRLFDGPTSSPEEVDRALTERAAAHAEKGLDWKNSVVDLLKLLDLPSDLPARKKLAAEMDYTGPLDGSAKMNTELHRRVMERVASERFVRM